MKPSIWSQKKYQNEDVNWHQGGYNINYDISPYHDENNKANTSRPKSYYMISFNYKFEYGGDHVSFAYTVPYRYTQILYHIKCLKTLCEMKDSNVIKFSSIGKSNGGLDLPLIQITNPANQSPSKPTILIIGRQHCGETYSSFIIHGLINFLISKDPLANKIRNIVEFWILPAMNPDGIVVGNYRCNTQGKDMNRFFFADDDSDANYRLKEVELI